MNETSAEFLATESEFAIASVCPLPCKLVAVPRVKESAISFECKLVQVIQHGNNNVVIGEVIGINIDDAVIDERGRIKTELLQAIGRMGGDLYTTTTEGNFTMKRPEAPNR